MSSLVSAGLLMYYLKDKTLKVFLVHPGGPYFNKKDDGYWGIPKGLVEVDEDLLDAAKREFEEETGIYPKGNFIELGTTIQKGGKTVHAWGFECNNDNPVDLQCNHFEMEWPPRSGRMQSFPEVDRGEFFDENTARKKIYSAQEVFIDRLKEFLTNGVRGG